MYKHEVHSIVLLLGLTLLLSTFMTGGCGANVSPELPQWHDGDWWTFSIEISGETNLVGKYTFTVVNDDVNISQNEQNFNCYQINASGEGMLSGEVEGNQIRGTWTITEQQYYRKSDQSWVATYSTYREKFTVGDDSEIKQISLVQDKKITSTTTIETTYDPPFEANKGFPLTVGESWSAATTETTTTQTATNWNLESKTETETYTKVFSVLRKEWVTLPIGETETYVVKITDPDGAYSEMYYSPDVAFDVKQVDYDSTGTVQVTLKLSDYFYPTAEYSQQHFSKIEILKILIILAIVAITFVAAVLLLKRRRTDQQSQTKDISI